MRGRRPAGRSPGHDGVSTTGHHRATGPAPVHGGRPRRPPRSPARRRLPEAARCLDRPPATGDWSPAAADRRACGRSPAPQAAGTAWAEDGDGLVVAVCRAGDGVLVGEVVPKLASARARRAETGWIFHPARGGRGCAAGAPRAVDTAAFGELAVHRLFAARTCSTPARCTRAHA
ncbi:GNAT family N-acetyltransferase [Streptomyces sp. LaBMicrA B280]|uniref:GNAT family N-acetyltransferase n=1 Tax=Streptomyces sp. LaBMicrA B280 TaxID=3391001 RepID=UPI003BA67425